MVLTIPHGEPAVTQGQLTVSVSPPERDAQALDRNTASKAAKVLDMYGVVLLEGALDNGMMGAGYEAVM